MTAVCASVPPWQEISTDFKLIAKPSDLWKVIRGCKVRLKFMLQQEYGGIAITSTSLEFV